ncbi:ATP-binding protein [Shewanella sp. VB17]|uniref:ATP-binding protein n=1 Tax=Shewanella sp. VB17 TaxID=2739432 RepID=UPI001566FA0E|nr:ATP-binding protein [Shewanella sp. VB17]NRD72682.1 ATP-binding protein [Shewanella sp. VB17]
MQSMANNTVSLSILLNKLGCPASVTPCTREHIKQLKLRDEIAAFKRHQSQKLDKLSGKSGLNKRFLACTFDNYYTRLAGQVKAVDIAQEYVRRFVELASLGKGFLFTGTPGTGKNHIASAIANELIAKHHSVMLMSVMDLFARARESYGYNHLTEGHLLSEFLEPDLLIIDEIGLQRGSRDELLWFTRILDKRLYANKPTGFVTNLDQKALQQLLGERAYQRLQDAVSVMVKFDWQSYRGKKRTTCDLRGK